MSPVLGSKANVNMPTKAGTNEAIMKKNRRLGLFNVTIPTIRNQTIEKQYCGIDPLTNVSKFVNPKETQTSLPKVVFPPFGRELTIVTKKKKYVCGSLNVSIAWESSSDQLPRICLFVFGLRRKSHLVPFPF